MMNNTLRYLTIGMLSFFCITSQANEYEGNDGQRHEKRFEHLTKRLELSEEQIDQMKSIMESQSEQRESIREEQKAVHLKMKALHDDFRQQLNGVLTEEQLEQFDKMHERRKMKMRHRKGDREHRMEGNRPMHRN